MLVDPHQKCGALLFIAHNYTHTHTRTHVRKLTRLNPFSRLSRDKSEIELAALAGIVTLSAAIVGEASLVHRAELTRRGDRFRDATRRESAS